jgi:hypothetical protein
MDLNVDVDVNVFDLDLDIDKLYMWRLIYDGYRVGPS